MFVPIHYSPREEPSLTLLESTDMQDIGIWDGHSYIKLSFRHLPSVDNVIVSLAPFLSNTSHNFSVLSHDALAKMAVDGLKLSELTGPSCPART